MCPISIPAGPPPRAASDGARRSHTAHMQSSLPVYKTWEDPGSAHATALTSLTWPLWVVP